MDVEEWEMWKKLLEKLEGIEDIRTNIFEIRNEVAVCASCFEKLVEKGKQE